MDSCMCTVSTLLLCAPCRGSQACMTILGCSALSNSLQTKSKSSWTGRTRAVHVQTAIRRSWPWLEPPSRKCLCRCILLCSIPCTCEACTNQCTTTGACVLSALFTPHALMLLLQDDDHLYSDCLGVHRTWSISIQIIPLSWMLMQSLQCVVYNYKIG